jgi:HAE1 family hydrophobic/amphiphilic exporter-1
VLQTSREKFRPVMMTSTTTIAAMLPLLLGLGGNTAFNRPLAATIIGGLLFTTALTLFLTPVLYEGFDRLAARSKSRQ